ncbi:hypothetical protein GGS20DRAFT_596438 [Poronia punctata]|nr:hypothetical protein GGS20DRAFT_596438 [Poronia punctata]
MAVSGVALGRDREGNDPLRRATRVVLFSTSISSSTTSLINLVWFVHFWETSGIVHGRQRRPRAWLKRMVWLYFRCTNTSGSVLYPQHSKAKRRLTKEQQHILEEDIDLARRDSSSSTKYDKGQTSRATAIDHANNGGRRGVPEPSFIACIRYTHPTTTSAQAGSRIPVVDGDSPRLCRPSTTSQGSFQRVKGSSTRRQQWECTTQEGGNVSGVASEPALRPVNPGGLALAGS